MFPTCPWPACAVGVAARGTSRHKVAALARRMLRSAFIEGSLLRSSVRGVAGRGWVSEFATPTSGLSDKELAVARRHPTRKSAIGRRDHMVAVQRASCPRIGYAGGIAISPQEIAMVTERFVFVRMTAFAGLAGLVSSLAAAETKPIDF